MTAGPTDAPRRRRWPWLIVFGMLFSQLVNGMTNVAVPSILTDLAVPDARAGWIISAYLLPVAVLMPAWGAAGDFFGRRHVFRIGLGIFALGSLLSALAPTFWLLLLGQAVQAAGASALNPNGQAIVGGAGGDSARGRLLGRLRMILSLAGIGGGPLGGLLVQVAGWHAVFALGPVAALALAVLLGRRPAAAAQPPAPTVRFDALGAALVSVSLLALMTALSLGQAEGWQSPLVIGLAVVAVAGLAVLGQVERRQPRPLIPPDLLHDHAYVAVIITCWLQAFACFGTALLGPLLLSRVFELTPSESGLLLATFQVGSAIGGLAGGWLADHLGDKRTTLASLLIVVAGLVTLRAAATGLTLALFPVGAAVTGFGAALGLIAMIAYVLQVSGEQRRGMAMGVFTMVSIGGDIVGVALLPTLLAGHSGPRLGQAFGEVYLVAAGVAALAILPALAMRPGRRQQEAAPAH